MSSDHVLIVVEIDNNTGDTRFLRSYISRDTFTKIDLDAQKRFKGFNIPSIAVFKNINDTCQSLGLSKQCIEITNDDDDFPQLTNSDRQRYGFILTSTANPDQIQMYSLDTTGEPLITSDEKEIRTEAYMVDYQPTQMRTETDDVVDRVFGLFEPSIKSKTYVKTIDRVWIRKTIDNPGEGIEASKDIVYEYKETKTDDTGNNFFHVYDMNGAEIGWLPEGLNDKKYAEIISESEAINSPDETPPVVSNVDQPETPPPVVSNVDQPEPPPDVDQPETPPDVDQPEPPPLVVSNVDQPETPPVVSKVDQPKIPPVIKTDQPETPPVVSNVDQPETPPPVDLIAKPVVGNVVQPANVSETKTSPENVREFNEQIVRLLGKPAPDLSSAIRAVAAAVAAAASAIGKIPTKSTGDLTTDATNAASNALASVTGSFINVFASDTKSELSDAINATAKAAAMVVGKLSAPMASAEPDDDDEFEKERKALLEIMDNKIKMSKENNAGITTSTEEIQKIIGDKIKDINDRSNKFDTLIESVKKAETVNDVMLAMKDELTNTEYLDRITEGDDKQLAIINDTTISEMYNETIKNARSKLTELSEIAKAKLAELQANEKAKLNSDAEISKAEIANAASNVAALVSDVAKALFAIEKIEAKDVVEQPTEDVVEDVDEGTDELKLKTETPESINSIISGLTPFIQQKDFEVNDKGLTGDALTIIGADKSGGGYLGNNQPVIEKANKYIDEFKRETSKLLSSPIFLKLTSLSTTQLSNIIKEPVFNRSKEGGTPLSMIEKKTMLSCIVNFLYSDFTFYVLFTENIQRLLLGNTFDNYQKMGPTQNNRSNYFALIDEKDRAKEPILYKDFSKLIEIKNRMIDIDLNKNNSNKSRQTKYPNGGKYKYVGFNNNEQIENQIQIRVGELTIYIKEFLGLLTKFQEIIANVISKSKKGKDPELPRGSYDLYDILIKYIKGKKEQLDQLNTTIIPIVEINTEVFKTKLEDEISNNSTNNIITYLKLRNDDHVRGIYNKRFNIMKHKEDNSLLVQYRDDNFEFHDTKNINKFNSLLLDKIKSGGEHDGIKLTNDTLDITTYKHNYLFGKFTDIFLPADNNQAIAEKMETIHDKITSGFPVFMLGYGASGAGKTSSLVYFNGGKTDEKDGILIHLCNKLSNEFGELEMCSREFFHVKSKNIGEKQKGLDDPDIFYTPQDRDQRIKFTLDANSRFVLKDPYSHVNHHQYRVLTDGADEKKIDIIAKVSADGNISYTNVAGEDLGSKKPANALITQHVFAEGTSLGAVAIHLIDTDRFVKATTNNPNSSRSHTLIFVKLIRTDKTKGSDGNIIIGDFAGVENAFACEDPLTIGKFLSVMREQKGDEPQVPYYSTEAYNGDPDPYGTLTGGTISDTCKPLISAKEGIYDFTNPVIRKSWIGLRDGVSRYCESNKANFKYAIDIIRNYSGTDVLKDYTETDITAAYAGDKIPEFINEFGIYSGDKGLIASQKAKIKMRLDTLLAYRKIVDKYNPNITAPVVDAKKLKGSENYYKATHDSAITAKDNLENETLDSISKKYNNSDAAPVSVLNSIFGSFKNAISKVDEINKIIAQENFVKPISPITNEALIEVFPVIRSYNETTWEMLSSVNSKKKKELTDVILKRISEFTNQLENIDSTNKANATKFDKILLDVGVNGDPKKIAADIYTNIISDSAFIGYIRDAEVEKACREGNSDVICQNRREEGMFINDSLAKVRGVISEILYEKNKDKVNISPEFIDECLVKYCSSDEGCFRFDRLTNASSVTTGSVIFDEIYKVLNDDNKYKTVQDLYNKIIVGVFCVFNISRKANNPPPTPYMDINDMKRRFSSGITDEETYTKFKLLGNKIIEMIENTRDATTLDNPIWFGDKVANLRSISSKSIPELYNAGEQVPKTIFDEFKYILTSTLGKFKANYTQTDMYKERIEYFINMVDNSNATSAIGTLDFLDKISKYNTVNVTCNTDDPNGFLPIEPAEAEVGFEDIQLEYVEIYSRNGGGGMKNNTKRRKHKHKTTTLKTYSRR
jgi:hypothetical protein